MASNDLKVVKGAGPSLEVQVDDRTTSTAGVTLKPGEPALVSATPQYAVLPGADFMLIGSDELWGIVQKESTETSTANGVVIVTTLLPGRNLVRGKALTSATADTQSEINALIHDAVTMAHSGTRASPGSFTIKAEWTGDNPNYYGCVILDGDPIQKTLDVCISSNILFASGLKGQTID